MATASTRRSGELPTSAVGLYLNRVGRISLLTAEQEVELAAAIAAGRAAAEQIEAQARRVGEPPQDHPDLRALVERGEDARTTMVNANLRLVFSIARRYAHCELALADLIQEGNLGLLRAVEKFDGNRGFRFSTYASGWIVQSIGRAVGQNRLVRVPPKVHAEVVAVRRCHDRLWEALGRTPDAHEVAAELGIDERRVRRLSRVDVRPVSLDDPMSDVGASVLADDGDAPDQVAHRRLVGEQVEGALGSLPGPERDVLCARFGIGGVSRSITSTAHHLGMSASSVRVLERSALAALRQRPALRRLVVDLNA